MPFSGNDLKRFNDFVHSLYVPQTQEALRRIVAQGILDLVHGDNAVSCHFDLRDNTVFDLTSLIPFHPDAPVDKLTSYFSGHPLFLAVKNPAFQGHYTISELIGRPEWHRKEVYNEFYRINAKEDEWALMSGDPSGLMNVTVILRQKRGFSYRDHKRLALLMPHLRQAFKNAYHFHKSIPLALAAQAHADLTEGMILLDGQKQILHCSESTRHLLETFFPEVPPQLGHLPMELEARLDHATPNACKRFIEHRSLEICFYRDKASERYLLTTHLHDPQVNVSRLSALGLSPRESEVLYWIGQGKRDQEIAVILGLSIYTVKTHIKSIFRRLGVETRTAAAAAAIPYIKK